MTSSAADARAPGQLVRRFPGVSWRPAGSAAPRSLAQVALLISLHTGLFALAFHPFAWWPLAFVCVAPLALAVRDTGPLLGYAAGFLGFFVTAMVTLHWLFLIGPGPWLGTALGFALYGLVFAFLGRKAARSGLPAAVWLPVIWCAIEFLRGTLFFYAFPWVFLGHAVYPLPMIQAADLFGQGFVSFGVALGSGVAVDLWDIARSGLPKSERRRSSQRVVIPVAAFLIAINLYGLARPSQIELVDGPRVLCVQSNLPQDLKVRSKVGSNERLDGLMRQTAEGARGLPVDVVAWPETMLPRAAGTDPDLPYVAIDQSELLRSRMARLGRHVPAAFLVGSLHSAKDADGVVRTHNALFWVDPDGAVRGRYDKVYLAPMSEYTPLEATWPVAYRWLRTWIPKGFVQLERGDSTRLFPIELRDDATGKITRVAKIGGSICFDVTFSRAVRAAVRAGAEGIVNVSNYAWFKDSAELDLARVHTIFRAIETRRGICCAVNAGITHFVDARGAAQDLVVDGAVKEVEGTMLSPLRTSTVTTLFVRIGEVFDWTLVALGFALAVFGWLRSRRSLPEEGQP